MRIWDPNTYDINGNTQEVSLEKPKDARSFTKKSGSWTFTTVEQQAAETKAAVEEEENAEK